MSQTTAHVSLTSETRLLDYLRTLHGLSVLLPTQASGRIEINMAHTRMTTQIKHNNKYLDEVWNFILEVCRDELEERIADESSTSANFWATVSAKLADLKQPLNPEQPIYQKNLDVLSEVVQETVNFLEAARLSWINEVGDWKDSSDLKVPNHAVICSLDILMLTSLKEADRMEVLWGSKPDWMKALSHEEIDAHIEKLEKKKKDLGYVSRRAQTPQDKFRMKWKMSEEDLIELTRKVRGL